MEDSGILEVEWGGKRHIQSGAVIHIVREIQQTVVQRGQNWGTKTQDGSLNSGLGTMVGLNLTLFLSKKQ